MKGSPVASSCSSPSSSSSAASSSASSSCVDSSAPPNHQLRPTTTPKSKRSKRNRTHQNAANRPCPSRSSMYRGVTRHRWTGRFEAHLWDKSSWNNIQTKKGRQVYLGAYDSEETAAHTHDLAALKYWGPDTTLNFPLETYNKELEEMQKVTKEEYLASLRRRSSGFSRGVSKYRGVARHHHNGRWEARIGRVLGNKYLYLGTYNTQEEAAEAYDMAAIEYRGPNAVTNFDISNYKDRLKKKGIHLDPSCSTESDDAETEVEQPSPPPPTPPPILHQRLMLSSPPPSVCNIDTTANPPMIAMEDATMDGDDHFTWGFCSEYFAGLGLMTTTTIPLSSSSVVVTDLPDLGIDGCELPDLFDEVVGGAFEDNIDLIFETCCSYDCGPHVEYDETSDTLGSGVVLEEEAGVSAGSAVAGDGEVVENGGKQTSPLVISCNHSL